VVKLDRDGNPEKVETIHPSACCDEETLDLEIPQDVARGGRTSAALGAFFSQPRRR